MKQNELHIGQLIKAKMEEERYSVSQLAEMLRCDRSNIYKIYGKQTINTDLLLQISKALHFDFFQYYSDTISGGK